MIRTIAVSALVLACGCASYPMPADRMAQAEAAARSAQETGANAIPQGQLHLKLAREEIVEAQALISDKHNKRADFVLLRAQADAELALAEAREEQARGEARKVLDQITFMRSYGAPPVTTTGAPLQEPKP